MSELNEYTFPQWFIKSNMGVAFTYLFNVCIQLSKDSNEELAELKTFFNNFPVDEPEDIESLHNSIKNILNVMILCDGYDIMINDIDLAHETIMKELGEETELLEDDFHTNLEKAYQLSK